MKLAKNIVFFFLVLLSNSRGEGLPFKKLDFDLTRGEGPQSKTISVLGLQVWKPSTPIAINGDSKPDIIDHPAIPNVIKFIAANYQGKWEEVLSLMDDESNNEWRGYMSSVPSFKEQWLSQAKLFKGHTIVAAWKVSDNHVLFFYECPTETASMPILKLWFDYQRNENGQWLNHSDVKSGDELTCLSSWLWNWPPGTTATLKH